MVSSHIFCFTMSFSKFHLFAHIPSTQRFFCLQLFSACHCLYFLNNTVQSADSDSAISRSLSDILQRSGFKTLPFGTLVMTSLSYEKGLLTVLFPIFHSVIYPCNYLFIGSVTFKSCRGLTSPNSFQRSMVSIPACLT